MSDEFELVPSKKLKELETELKKVKTSAEKPKNSPKEYTNILNAFAKIENKFEVDYWALSNKQALEFILLNNNKDYYKIYPASHMNINTSKLIFSNLKKKTTTIKQMINYQKSNYLICALGPPRSYVIMLRCIFI